MTINKVVKTYIYKHSTGEQVFVMKQVKRIQDLNPCWHVGNKSNTKSGKDNHFFYDHLYGGWRQSLMAAEAFLNEAELPTNRAYGKPKYKLITVRRPYSKDPTDLIKRIRLVRFNGGYKFFDLDTTLSESNALFKASFEAEDYHWEEGIRLKLIKYKPDNHLMAARKIKNL